MQSFSYSWVANISQFPGLQDRIHHTALRVCGAVPQDELEHGGWIPQRAARFGCLHRIQYTELKCD